MKELESPLLPDKVKITTQRQVEKQKILFDSVVKHNGHTMWEINCSTGKVVPAEYKEQRIEFVDERCLLTGAVLRKVPKTVRDVDCKPNCMYIPSLNKQTALKKFFRYLATQNGQIK